MKTKFYLIGLVLLSGIFMTSMASAQAKPSYKLSDLQPVSITENGGTPLMFEIERGANTGTDAEVVIEFKQDAKLGEDFTVNPTAEACVFTGLTFDCSGSTTVSSGPLADEVTVVMPTDVILVRVLIEPINDDEDEGDNTSVEELEIEIKKNDPVYLRVDPKKLSTHIFDDDVAAILITDESGATTSEAGDTMTFNVSLQTQPDVPVEITISSENTDEGLVAPTTLTFNPTDIDLWNVKQQVTVTGQPDNGDEGPGTAYQIRVEGPSGGGAAAFYEDLPDQLIDLTNLNVAGTPGQIQTDPTYSVNESLGTIQVRAERFGGSTGVATVDYETIAGDPATADVDYTTTTGTFTWLDTESGAMFVNIPITDDNIVESPETFVFRLTNATGATLAATDEAVVTINDDDSAGVISIDPIATTVAEAGGTVTIQAIRTGDNAGEVSATFTTADISAEAGSDYEAASATVTFAADDSTPQDITITITDDVDVESDQTFTVTLTNPTNGATLGTNTVSTITIEDNDAVGELTIDPASVSVNESAGTVDITVERVGGSSGPVSATVNTVDGSATTADSDYVAIAGGTVDFLNGETQQTITVTINDDNNEEGDEDFTVVISGAAVSGNDTATVTITDDDDAGVIAIVPGSYIVDEDVGTASVTVTRTGAGDGAVAVDFTTVDGTAKDENSDNDYTLTSGTFNWADGNTDDKTVNVPIIDDAVSEASEAFTVVISNPTNGATLGNDTGTVTINASDDVAGGTITIDPASYIVNEGGTASVTVKRINGTDGDVTVDFTTTNGTAEDEGTLNDFTANAGTLTWLDGNADDQTIDVLITDDTESEGDEVFTVDLSNVANSNDTADPLVLNSAIGTGSATVTISANDTPGEIAIASATYSVAENGGLVTITFTRTLGDDGVVGATVTTTDGSAVSPDDFAAVASSVSFADQNMDDQTIDITIVDDNLQEGDQTFTVNLTTPTGDATLGLALSTVTIIDDDSAGVIAIDPDSVAVDEDAGTAVLTVTRTGGNDGAVDVTVNTADGSANAGSDYTAIVAGTVSFADQDSASKSISVSIIDDVDSEGDETLTATISAPTSGATLGNAVGTITINANDTPGVIQVDPTSVAVDEDAGTAAITVTRTGGSVGAASVDIATADGVATAGSDYVAVSTTLNWADGNSDPQVVNVTIIDDAVEEPAEDFTATLSNEQGSTLGDSVVTVTIAASDSLTEDKGTVGINPASYFVNEGAGFVSVLVTRTVGSDGEISADWTTQTGTAGAGDFTEDSGTITWADEDAATKVIQIAITDDIEIEAAPNEIFTVVLSNLTDEVTEGNLIGTVNIVDNDEPESGALSVAEVGVVEQDGAVAIAVTRIGGTDGAFSVDWTTADNTAVSGGDVNLGLDDYVPALGTLNWADGEGDTKQISVTLKEDTFTEMTEIVDLVFSYTVDEEPLIETVPLSIFDNDSSGELTISDITVSELQGTATLVVRREGSNIGTAFVEYQTFDGSATDENSTNDYTSQNGSFTWLEGEGCQGEICNNGERYITINIVRDALKEPNEFLTVELFNEQGSDGTAASISVTKRVGVINITNPVPIPTLNEWMLILLALMLGSVGYRELRRRIYSK